MKEEAYKKHIDTFIREDEGFWSEDYIWATSQESKRDALSLHLIGSIVHRHGGTVTVDSETRAVKIDVPDEKREALAEELGDKVDMTTP
ncbi:MAG: hypothetical protein SWQ30_03250 [Thermodesulfobacteriota bacterium]|nr:hypothetical protein [Thermodesulfobacteriota bacterium]